MQLNNCYREGVPVGDTMNHRMPALFLCLLAPGCDARRTSQESAAPASSYVPLPHTRGIADTEEVLFQKDLARLPAYCNHLHDWLTYLPDDIEMIGQCETVLRYAASHEAHSQQPPIAIFARYGLDGDGRPYLSIDTFNTNRETQMIRVLVRGPDGTIVYMAKHMSIESKRPGVLLPIHNEGKVVTWRQLVGMASDTGGRLGIMLRDFDPVPFVLNEDVVMAAAIEDRNGMMSNYVKTYRLDMNRGRVPIQVDEGSSGSGN